MSGSEHASSRLTVRFIGSNSAVAATLYLLRQFAPFKATLGIPIDELNVLNLLYLADKRSWSEVGRSITGEIWSAQHHGARPAIIALLLEREDTCEELMRLAHGDHPQWDSRTGTPPAQPAPEAQIIADWLSVSDRLCLDAVLGEFRRDLRLSTRSAKDTAWQAGRARVGNEMLLEEIIGTLGNSRLILEHLRNP